MESDAAMAKHIVIDGLPGNIVPAKQDFFKKFLFGVIEKKIGHQNFVIHFCVDDATGLVNGAFVTFVTPKDAEKALSQLNRFPLTKTEVLATYRWNVFNIFKEDLTEYVPPKREDEVATDLSNAMMEDERARQMFFTKSGPMCDVELFWYDNLKTKVELFKKPNVPRDDNLGKMTELDRTMKRAQPGLVHGIYTDTKPLPVWSPYGTMLVSQHHSGLKFWGGDAYSKLFEIAQDNITAFHISPLENYIIIKTDRDVSVWNLRQSKKLKVLAGFDPSVWPVAKFNADDTFVAFAKDGKLSVFESATMKLVQGGEELHSYTLNLENLVDFEWSPTRASQLALMYKGDQHTGWRVTVDEVTLDASGNLHLENLSRRNFLGAEGVVVLWHPEGTGLAAKISKAGSKRVVDDANAENGKRIEVEILIEYCLFRIHNEKVSADHFTIEKNFLPGRFAWQPAGKYFAILLIDKNSNQQAATGPKMFIRFYALDGKGLKLAGTHPTSATTLHWAPKGTRIVAANYEKSQLEFFAINSSGVAVAVEKAEHSQVSDTQWDPSGRYFASWNSVIRCPEGTRYRIHDMNGRRVIDNKVEKLSHFAWRPLAKPVLTAEEIAEIKSRMKEISHAFEEKEQELVLEQEQKRNETKRKAEEEYIKRMNDIAAYNAPLAEERSRLRACAPAAIAQANFMKSHANEMVVDRITESRVKSTEELKG